MIYIVNLIVLSVIAIIIFQNPIDVKLKKKIFLWCSFCSLAIISGFRGSNVGTDTKAYHRIFNNVVEGGEIFNQEFGYILFNKLIGIISENSQSIIIATSVVTTAGICLFIYFNSPNVWLSIFLYVTMYYYFFSFNAVRQFMALSIVLIAFSYAKRQKIIPFLTLIFLASTFHLLSFLGLILYYVYWNSPKLNKIFKINATILLFGILYYPTLNILIDIYPRYAIYIGEYTESSGGIMVPIMYSLIFFLGLIAKPKEDDTEFNALLIISSIAAALGILGYFTRAVNRPAWLFDIFSIVFIPHIMKSKFWKSSIYISYFILIVICVSYMFYYFGFNWHYILPYKVAVWE